MIDLTSNILYEDTDILVINKPVGLIVHPDGRTKEESVSEWFVSKYPEAKEVGEPILQSSGQEIVRPGVVHRIDRETSGCLILAKTKQAHAILKEQFQTHEIEKTYHLFVHGDVKDDRGTINLPIGKSVSDFRKYSAQRGAKGEKRDAITFFQVLKRAPELGVTLVEAKPQTGRTHQIRVHFQALQRPIVGDNLYAVGKPKLLGFERLGLHAYKVAFRNLKGEKIIVEAPYPEDFQKALKKLGL